MPNINLICSNCHEELFSGSPYWTGSKGFICPVCNKTTSYENIIPINTTTETNNILWILLFIALIIPYPLAFFLSLYVREKINKKLGTNMLWVFLIITILLNIYCVDKYFEYRAAVNKIEKNMRTQILNIQKETEQKLKEIEKLDKETKNMFKY